MISWSVLFLRPCSWTVASCFGVLTKSSTTSEKQVLIDLQTVKDAYQFLKVNDVAFIRSEHNTAGASTVVKQNVVLLDALNLRSFDCSVEQWIIGEKDTEYKWEDKGSGNARFRCVIISQHISSHHFLFFIWQRELVFWWLFTYHGSRSVRYILNYFKTPL